ncbi:MAG: multidrug effflux MFS transporter [Caulobacteraceae bacterium]|nr:multidrug effflux MFS transporter [Caulobacter sp.]
MPDPPPRRAADAVRGEAAAPIAPGAVLSDRQLAGKAKAPWGEVMLLGGLTMFGSVAMDMYLPALPHIAGVLHASPRAAQATISIFLFGLAAGQLVFGPLSDRWGRRPPILWGVALFVLSTAGCAIVTDAGVLIALRLLQAVGACAGMVVARAVVRDRYEDNEVLHVFSLLTLVFGVAPVLAPLVGGWVLAVAGWRAIFAVQAAFGVLVGLIAFVALPESRSQATRLKARAERPGRSYLALLRKRRLVGYLLTGSLSGAALFSYITAAPEVVMGVFHIPAEHFGWVFGTNSVGLIAAGQLNARLARRIYPQRLLMGALLVAIAAAAVLVVDAYTGWAGVWGVLVPLFVVISGFGMSQPNAGAEAMKVDRTRAGGTSALLGFGSFGAGALAGAMQALVGGGPVKSMAWVILGALLSALLAYELLVRRPEHRAATGQPASTA